MSYKNYSKDAVEAIIQNKKRLLSSKESGRFKSTSLSLEELIEVGAEVGLNSEEVRNAAYRYDHPEIIRENRITDTHLFVEKKFTSSLAENILWDKITLELDDFFSDADSGQIKVQPLEKRWTYTDHANHETIVNFKKYSETAKLKISQRVGFWNSKIEGILHGAYLSFILLGFVITIFSLELPEAISILTLLWLINAVVIYSFNVWSRKKKLKSMENLVERIVERLSSSNN